MISSWCGEAIGDLTATMTLMSNPPSQSTVATALRPASGDQLSLIDTLVFADSFFQMTRRGRFKTRRTL